MQQLKTDLTNNTVARYNWITPDLYNTAHSSLPNGFTYKGTNYTGDQAAVAQGDNFLSIIVPLIQSSAAYQNNGVIIIWFDETEGGDTPAYTIPEIILSPLAKGNAYSNALLYTHSSDLLTTEEIFGVGPCIGAACSATDLSNLFQPGAVRPTSVATPVALPAAGTYTGSQSVALTDSTAGTVIYYNINGGSYAKYTAPLTISSSEALQAVALLPAIGTIPYEVSTVLNASYTINAGVATPLVTPAGGTYTGTQRVTMTDSTPNTIVYYTINSGAYAKYTGPVSVSVSETIQTTAVVPASGGKPYQASATVTNAYTIQ